MSKSNVNPNHYKVAGRERQGEDITQAWHKQKHAESLVRRRFGPDVRFQQPAPVQATASAGAAPSLAAKQTVRKADPKTVKKRSEEPRPRSPERGRDQAPRPAAGAPKRSAARRLKKERPTAKQAKKKTRVSRQGAGKRGKRSTAQKRSR
jgi:hypothetical protein